MEGDPHLVIEGMALAALRCRCEARRDLRSRRVRHERPTVGASSRAGLSSRMDWATWFARLSGVRDQRAPRCRRLYLRRGKPHSLESLEGRRGEPRLRPPYPTTRGLFGRPTVVNNVETLCAVPAIIRNGADWFRSHGAPGNPGSKVFSISGHVRRPAAFEAPLGVTVRSILNQFGLGKCEAGRRLRWRLPAERRER